MLNMMWTLYDDIDVAHWDRIQLEDACEFYSTWNHGYEDKFLLISRVGSHRDGGGKHNFKLHGFEIRYHIDTLKINGMGSFWVLTNDIG